MVFQNYALYPHMSVYDNMAYGLRNRKTPKSEIEARVARSGAAFSSIEPLARSASRASSRADSVSALPWAAPSCASRRCSCSTSRLSNLDAKLRVADADRDPAAAAAAGDHHDLRDARSGRGDDARRPAGRHECRPHRADRRAARIVRAARDAVRRRLSSARRR